MIRRAPVWSLLLALLLAPALAAQDLEKARSLYAHELHEDAREELYKILYSDETFDSQKAAALDLLGTIEADLGNYQEAYRTWAQLLREYPDAEEAAEAGTRLSMTREILELRGEEIPTTWEEASPEDTPAEAGTEASEDAAEPVPAPEVGDASGPVPAPEPATPAVERSGVLVAGHGTPEPVHREALVQIMDFLAEQGVDARGAPAGIGASADRETALPFLTQAVRERGAVSSLYVYTRFGWRERIEVHCHDLDGKLVWEEKVVGGTARQHGAPNPLRRVPINERLMERLEKNLARRVGNACLPTG